MRPVLFRSPPHVSRTCGGGGTRRRRYPWAAGYTASFNSLPARKVTFLLALIFTASPVCGLRPIRASRLFTWKIPSPTIRTLLPFTRCLASRSTVSVSMVSAWVLGSSCASAISAAICFSVTTGAGVLAFATAAGVLPLATGAGAVLALTVLAAGFFAGDLVVAAGFLTNEILRIIMSRKPVCTLTWELCKPGCIEISCRATPNIDSCSFFTSDHRMHQRLSIIGHGPTALQLPEQSTILRVAPSSTGDPRLRGALHKSKILKQRF